MEQGTDQTAGKAPLGPRPYGQWAIDAWLLGVLLLVFARVYYVYPQLPEQIPTHFAFSGLPDGWAAKGFWSVYALLAFALLMGVVMSVITWFIGRARDPRNIINMPGKERLTAAGVEALRTITMRLLGVVKLLTVTMMAHMQWLVIDTALGERDGMGYVPLIYMVLLIAGTLYMTIALVTATSEGKRPTTRGSTDG